MINAAAVAAGGNIEFDFAVYYSPTRRNSATPIAAGGVAQYLGILEGQYPPRRAVNPAALAKRCSTVVVGDSGIGDGGGGAAAVIVHAAPVTKSYRAVVDYV